MQPKMSCFRRYKSPQLGDSVGIDLKRGGSQLFAYSVFVTLVYSLILPLQTGIFHGGVIAASLPRWKRYAPGSATEYISLRNEIHNKEAIGWQESFTATRKFGIATIISDVTHRKGTDSCSG